MLTRPNRPFLRVQRHFPSRQETAACRGEATFAENDRRFRPLRCRPALLEQMPPKSQKGRLPPRKDADGPLAIKVRIRAPALR